MVWAVLQTGGRVGGIGRAIRAGDDVSPGKEEEGNYHGSVWGNGYKGKTEVQDVGFGWVVGEKAISAAELYWKRTEAPGKSSFELDMER